MTEAQPGAVGRDRVRHRRAAARLHRGRGPALGCAPPALGRARQPRTRRGTAGLRPARPARDYRRLRRGLRPRSARGGRRTAYGAARRRRTCTPRSRTGSPAGCPAAGERLHTGRSRNDQVACDLRLYLKDRLLDAARRGARRWWTALLRSPPATARRSGPATPTSGARCRRRSASGPAAYAEGLLDTRRGARSDSGRRSIARRSAAPRATACRCRFGARSRRARSASAGSTATWPRCRAGGASSRRPRSSGALSWRTSWRGSRRT